MSFHRIVQNLFEKENIDVNTFLLVTWFGRSFYEGVGSKQKVWKEIIIANIASAKYDNSLWENSIVFKVVIPEVEIVSVPLGSIYNSKGKLVLNPLNPSEKAYGLYTPRLKLTKDIEIVRTGLYALLSTSIFPYYRALNTTELERVYNKAPYYLFSKGTTDYILPIHVVNSFFYYKNSRCVHHIAFNEVLHMFDDICFTDNMTVVPYHGGFVASEDAKFFSKFLFLTCDNGINCLKKIPIELLENSINLNSSNRAYMLGGFPFQGEADLQVVGQYITNSNKGERNKFLIYGITEFKPAQPLFKLLEYSLYNLEDKRSTDNDRQENVKSYNAIQIKEVVGGKSSSMGSVNSSVPIKKDSFSSTFFEESPLVQVLDREDQIGFYEKGGVILQEIESYSKNYNDTYSKSKIGRSSTETETLIEGNEYFRLFKDVILEIGKIDNYTTEIFEVKIDHLLGKDFHLPIVLCASVVYKGYYYSLLDYGLGTAIPIFRYRDATLSMRYSEIEDLIIMIYNMDCSWAKILKEQKENKRYLLEGIYVLATRNHPSSIKDYQEGVKSLKSRICNNIFEDRNFRK